MIKTMNQIVCVECGHEIKTHHKYCTYCGAPVPSFPANILSSRLTTTQHSSLRLSFATKRVLSIIFIILITITVGSTLIFLSWKPLTPIDPDIIDWMQITVPDAFFTRMPWANIDDAKYAVEDNDLYFLVKWNSSSRMPASVVPPHDLLDPYYLIYRKAYISWIIHDNTRIKYSKIQLLVGDNDFVLYEFVEGEGCVDFSYITDDRPFVNETTTAFNIRYKQRSIPIEKLHNISIMPASEFIAHNHYTQHEFQSLLEIPESPSESINIDGNLSDWEQFDTSSSTLKADTTNQTETFIFPTFDHLFLTRTDTGIYTGVCFSHKNFTEFIVKQETLIVNISWTTLISAINGSFASDYAFCVSLSFSPKNGYSIQNVTIELLAGIDSPTISEEWQLPYNHSGTNAGFECLFPVSIISPLYDTKNFISFSTWLEIEWIAQVN